MRQAFRSSGALAVGLIALPMLAAGPAAAQRQDAPSATIDTARIVVAGGAITEILYSLGAADRIAAVDTTSNYPPDALKTKKSIGYMRALSTEGVLSMQPSVIIASDKAGPAEVVKALKASSVAYVEVDDRPEPSALLDRIRAIAALVHREDQGAALVRGIEAEFSALNSRRGQIEKPARALFILSVQNGRVLVGGRNTAADAMLVLAGARNVAGAIDGYKPIADETLISLDPEVIVVMTRSSAPPVRSELEAVPSVMSSAAGRSGRIIEMDGLLLLGFGPRAPAAASVLMENIYGARPAGSIAVTR